jgi:DNA-binding MarR family transcriptional regulator/GNAT superfamily N-acetyltransferase
MAEADEAERQAAEVRGFNRVYTRQIGLLDAGVHRSAFSLTEARVLYELGHRLHLTASALARELRLDPGYLSRLLKKLRGRGYVQRHVAGDDARQAILGLTEAGRTALGSLEAQASREIAVLLGALAPEQRAELLWAMARIRALLDPDAEPVPYLLRPPQPGDLGWVIHRHGALYAEEYGWDDRFEVMVAEIGVAFFKGFDPLRERCWIAERQGAVVGSAFIARASETVAKLRLLYVEPSARGLGIGARLVDECIRFARRRGYVEVTLWTNSILVAARRIYESRGFRLVEETPHRSFGKDLVGQTWVLTLREG